MNNTHGKRLFICTIGIPHKSKGASLVLFYHYIHWLRKSGFRILHLVLLQPDFEKKDFVEYCATMSEEDRFDVISYCAKRYYEVQRVLPRIKVQSLNLEVIQRIKEFNADYILCFDIIAAAVIQTAIKRESFVKRFIWLGDLNFLTCWYHAVYDVRENFKNILRLPFFLILSWLWKRFYKTLLLQWDSVIVSSKSSEKILAGIGIHSEYLPYPWSIDGGSGVSQKKYEMPSFVFFGTLTGLGSRSAFHFLTKFLYKRLVSLWGEEKFQIFICGSRGLPSWVEKRLSSMREIKYLGYVDDLGKFLVRCHGVIVPIDVPVGNRSRIVTAMAVGVPVIAHKNTALGNPLLIDGKTCYLARNDEDFARKIQHVYEDAKRSKIIADNARHAYDMAFRPDVAGKMLVQKILS